MAKAGPVTLPTAADILASTARLSALEKVTTVATRPSLPYFAPAESLPAPLPTVDEILAATPEPYGTGTGVRVYRVREHFAVKYGSSVGAKYNIEIPLQEGENMLFVQQSTNIPVPKLYAMFYDEKTKLNFIIQEFISGHILDWIWGDLDLAQRQAITSQMRRNMDELRSIPSPGYYGGIWRQKIRCSYFVLDHYSQRAHPNKAISGPHETEEEWTEAMLRYLDTPIAKFLPPTRFPAVQRAHRRVFNGHGGSVFTHSHLYGSNLILREDGTIVITNWQNAGWYPAYWEFCCSSIKGGVKHWEWYVLEMLDEHIAERDLLSHHMRFIHTFL